MKKVTMLILFFSLLLSLPKANASEEIFAELKESFDAGKFWLDMRYRYEFVDQDGVSQDSKASTLRTKLGYKSGDFRNFLIGLEFESIEEIGADNYNNTLNGRSDHPVVADVEATEVNQAYLAYKGFDDTLIKGGRQVITLDNHRFVGHVGWRQNNQTFDAVTISNKSFDDTVLKYGYIYNVNRIFGDDSTAGDFKSFSHYLNVKNTTMPLANLTAYAYLFDFDDDSPALSSRTIGGSVSGKTEISDDVWLKYLGEIAIQSDYGNNATDYDALYYHIAPAVSFKGLTAKVGYEVLGSDDSVASFKTPLATLHKFNGWADVFLATPAAGLQDLYVELAYKVAGLEDVFSFLNGTLVKFQYHNFEADDGGMDYGDEIGIYVKKPINKHVFTEVKYADYNADDFATDRQKLTFGLGVKF